MDLGKSGLDVVGFKYQDQKYCPDCFVKVTDNRTVKFSPIYRAVIIQSSFKTCDSCNKDLNNGTDKARN